jgi:hypothetical protein
MPYAYGRFSTLMNPEFFFLDECIDGFGFIIKKL